MGIDANASALRELSGRASRAGIGNLIYARAALEELPGPLAGAADRVSIVLPWGSLLAAVVGRSPQGLRNLRGLCQAGAVIRVLVSLDPQRDRAELDRLGIAPVASWEWDGELASVYAEAGLELRGARPVGTAELASWPSTWAKRLAHGRPRDAVELEARAGR